MAGNIPSSVIIDQDRDFFLNVTYNDPTGQPIDLTSFTAVFALASNNNIVLNLVSPTDITLGADGTIAIHATSDQTDIPQGQYVAELVVVSASGVEYSLLKGQIIVSGAVAA